MINIRNKLKSWFSAGKNPKEDQFHSWIDSFFHKTEDGLSLGEEGQFGVGVDHPQARLHIGGGLRIGNVPDEAATRGTLRWTGSKLEIFFLDEWHVIFPKERGQQETFFELDTQTVANPDVSLPSINSANQTASREFPAGAIKLISIAFTINGMLNYTDDSTINPYFIKDKIDVTFRVDGNTENLINQVRIVAFPFTKEVVDKKYVIDPPDIDLENHNTFIFHFGRRSDIRQGNQQVQPDFPIIIKKIELTYQMEGE